MLHMLHLYLLQKCDVAVMTQVVQVKQIMLRGLMKMNVAFWVKL